MKWGWKGGIVLKLTKRTNDCYRDNPMEWHMYTSAQKENVWKIHFHLFITTFLSWRKIWIVFICSLFSFVFAFCFTKQLALYLYLWIPFSSSRLNIFFLNFSVSRLILTCTWGFMVLSKSWTTSAFWQHLEHLCLWVASAKWDFTRRAVSSSWPLNTRRCGWAKTLTSLLNFTLRKIKYSFSRCLKMSSTRTTGHCLLCLSQNGCHLKMFHFRTLKKQVTCGVCMPFFSLLHITY